MLVGEEFIERCVVPDWWISLSLASRSSHVSVAV